MIVLKKIFTTRRYLLSIAQDYLAVFPGIKEEIICIFPYLERVYFSNELL
jgi:hypothetical protein